MTERIATAVRVAVAASVTALVAGSAGSAAAEPGHTTPDGTPGVFEDDRVEVAPSRAPIASVAIDNPLGNLRIEGHDGAGLVILSTKRAPDDDVLDRLRVSLIPDADGALRIVTAVDPEGPPVPRGKVRIDLVIRAPRGARIDGRVRDGRLELVNMDAGGELDTARGPILVENVSGPVFARSLAGAQRFAEVFGTLDAQTVAADVTMDTIRGERLVASAHDGRIHGRRIRSRHVELRTTRGDVVLDGEISATGAISVASVTGNVDVRVRALGALRVRALAPTVTVAGGTALGGDVWAFGSGDVAHGAPAAIELRSRRGTVRFTVVE
jgi:hypothetical protein